MKSGVLPDWRIKELIREGVILGADEGLVNTSSLDLRLGDEAWKLLGSFLPFPGQKIENALSLRDFVDGPSTKQDRFYFECLQQYAVRLVESLDLPNSISARVFNKSGRGRIGISLKALTDGTQNFDVIKNGYKGDIYAEVCTTSFPIVVHSEQTAIPQIRFYEGNPQSLSGSELELLLRAHPILTNDEGKPAYDDNEKAYMIRTGKLTFTANIPKEGLLAYVAKRDKRTLDLSRKGLYLPEDFFREEVRKDRGEGTVVIHPGDFVLINSKESIRLPPFIAAEIDEYSSDLGDMKSHYAGLINASHGYDPRGENVPSHIVFEIRARDMPIIIRDGQPLARFDLYRMLGEPEGSYSAVQSTTFKDLKSILPTIFKR